MLTAKTKDGKTISLLKNWRREDLANESFYCPVCKTPVLIKTGEKRRWHFAHQNRSACGQSEPESEYHLQGKKALYEWLQREQIDSSLEPYIAAIKQRPDLFVFSHKLAIEFQCATMPDNLFLQRTSGYVQLKVNPLWILGGNRLNRTGTHTFRMNRMDWLALRETYTSAAAPYVLYFCPNTDQFAWLSNLIPYTATKVMATITFRKRKDMTWDDLFFQQRHTAVKPAIANWQTIKKYWRSPRFRVRSPAASYVNKMLRSERTYLALFPPEAGIPVRALYWIETPAFLWQTWLLLHCIHPVALGRRVHFNDVYTSFQRMLVRNIFTVRALPLIKQTHYAFAIMDYLQKLEKMGILKRTGKRTFVKKKAITFPRTVRDAVKKDEEMQTMGMQ